MARSAEAIVKGELLEWARTSAGFGLEQVARKAGVSVERLQAWERGQMRPTVVQLRKLAEIYRRPLAVFYLQEVPRTFDALHDFRRLYGESAPRESPELRLEIRRARYRREVALDLAQELDERIPELTAGLSLDDSPETAAEVVRALLGIAVVTQSSWHSEYEAFGAWRSALERVGVLVLQAVDVGVAEMRGFTVAERPLPVIVVNIKDSPRGRIFSLLHEFVHLLLADGGVCDLREDADRHPHEERVEVFCNHVAGAALLPAEVLVGDPLVAKLEREWSDDDLRRLARRFWVSREAILRRLVVLGRVSGRLYRVKREQFLAEYQRVAAEPREGFAPPHVVAFNSAGAAFTALVLEAYRREQLTASDVADYLEVRLKHLPQIEQDLRRAG